MCIFVATFFLHDWVTGPKPNLCLVVFCDAPILLLLAGVYLLDECFSNNALYAYLFKEFYTLL